MTLVELMIVVVIVGVMSFAALFALSASANASNAAALARALQFTAQRARGEAVGDNKQRAITCDGTTNVLTCTYKIANVAGTAAVDWTDATKYAVDGNLPFGKHALVWNMTPSIDVATDNSGTKMLVAKTISFKPDGTSSGGTFYVADTNAKTSNKHKIYIYTGTGMARLVSNW